MCRRASSGAHTHACACTNTFTCNRAQPKELVSRTKSASCDDILGIVVVQAMSVLRVHIRSSVHARAGQRSYCAYACEQSHTFGFTHSCKGAEAHVLYYMSLSEQNWHMQPCPRTQGCACMHASKPKCSSRSKHMHMHHPHALPRAGLFACNWRWQVEDEVGRDLQGMCWLGTAHKACAPPQWRRAHTRGCSI